MSSCIRNTKLNSQNQNPAYRRFRPTTLDLNSVSTQTCLSDGTIREQLAETAAAERDLLCPCYQCGEFVRDSRRHVEVPQLVEHTSAAFCVLLMPAYRANPALSAEAQVIKP